MRRLLSHLEPFSVRFFSNTHDNEVHDDMQIMLTKRVGKRKERTGLFNLQSISKDKSQRDGVMFTARVYLRLLSKKEFVKDTNGVVLLH